MKIHGYDSDGPDTLGAQYAREHPDDPADVPEGHPEARPGERTHIRTGRFGFTVTNGQAISFEGIEATVQAATDAGLVLDVRSTTPEYIIAHYLNPGRLVLWRGSYWHITAVKGVYMVLHWWGNTLKRRGFRLHFRKGRAYVAGRADA